jgi:predicted lipoprotein with Yx(FWY)xxD motif
METMKNAIFTIAFLAGFVTLGLAAWADRHGNEFVHSRSFNGEIYVMYQDHMSLYTYDADEVGKSNCYGECTEEWIPALLEAGTKLGKNYSVIERTDGTLQAAFRGLPLYLFYKDRKPGNTLGDGIDGVWRLARP